MSARSERINYLIPQLTPTVDTNGLLDRCSECGARGAFVKHWHGASVDCTECANGTSVEKDNALAMVAWNKAQREKNNGTK